MKNCYYFFQSIRVGGIIIVLGILEGCQYSSDKNPHDDTVGKTREEFKQLSIPPCAPPPFTGTPLLASRAACLPACFSKKISLSLSGKVPINDALFELARQAKINVVLEGKFPKASSLMYCVNQQPLGDVLENLCAIGNLRYYFQNNILHVCQDTPFLKTHNVQFLLGSRKTKTKTSVTTDIFSEGIGESSSRNRDNGTSIDLDTCHTVDFWEELEKNLCLMLSRSAGSQMPKGEKTYSLNKYGGILSLFATEKQHRMVACYLRQIQKVVTTQILIEAKIIEIDLLDQYRGGVNWNAFFVKGASVVKKMVVPSVLGGGIPAAATGVMGVINPDQIPLGGLVGQKRNIEEPFSDTLNQSFSAMAASSNNEFSFRMRTNYLDALAAFMEKFGTIRTLANPRQTVINNQSAVLKVAHNEVFFEVKLQDNNVYSNVAGANGRGGQRNWGGYGSFPTAQSTIRTVPIGLILYVHPSVNFETGEIIVSLHPTISRVVARKIDPITSFANRDMGAPPIVSEVPVVQTREMDSVIVARENQVIVTGGLMEERVQNDVSGVPGLSEVPILGSLFSNKDRKVQMTELVILLKLSLVRDQSNMSPADHRLYEGFTRDPRPFFSPSSD